MRRWLDHTSEVTLDIVSPTETGVFTEALAGLAELLAGDEPPGAASSAPVAVQAADRPALLVAWLEELLWLAERDRAVPEGADVAIEGDRLQATVRWRARPPRPLVKAVTWHDLRFEPAGDGYHARVVFDV